MSDLSPYQAAREAMVKDQLAARGIRDKGVLDAMSRIPRHLFAPSKLSSSAYDDRPLSIGHGQTISQPYMAAIMTELLHVSREDKVLEIGTGSGYQAAVLSALADRVITIERLPALAEEARARFAGINCDNVTVVEGDGTLGWEEEAPYDGIIVTAGGPGIPSSLKAQLADGGRLVCPVGPRQVQELIILERTGDTFSERHSIGCMFVPLIGQEGWDSG